MPEQPVAPLFRLKPLVREMHADTETPVSVYLKLQRQYSCLLESVEGEEFLARFLISPLIPSPFSRNGQRPS